MSIDGRVLIALSAIGMEERTRQRDMKHGGEIGMHSRSRWCHAPPL
jgi:hypothetical protein